SLCFKSNTPEITVARAKRYIQAVFSFEKIIPTAFILGLCEKPRFDEDGKPVYCDKGYDVKTSFKKKISWAGYGMARQFYPFKDYNAVEPGDNVSVTISPDVTINFEKVTSTGTVGALITSGRPALGYVGMTDNVVLDIWADLGFTGQARVSTKYTTAGLSPSQISMAKMYKVIDPSTEKYQELAADFDPTNQIASANIDTFGKFMVATPEYENPQFLASANTINGKPEMEFLSGTSLTQAPYDINTEQGQTLLAAMKKMDKLPVSNVYQIGPDNAILEPSGVVKMRYSESAWASLGADENTLELYQFTTDGRTFIKLPYLTSDKDNNVLTAKIPSLTSLFAILASSRQAENYPPDILPDRIAPVTQINFSGPVYGQYISTRAQAVLSAADPQYPNVFSSGVFRTFYSTAPEISEVNISTYTEPFSLLEGTHTVYYFSNDNAGNYEFPKSTVVYVDGTAPETTVLVSGGQWSADGKTAYITETDSITLTAVDPVSNNIASGVKHIGMLINTTIDQCISTPTFTGPPGTCENPLYSGPFTLSTGTHTVYFKSIDNVGNEEEIKSIVVVVSPLDAEPPV
ncbi:MAG: hypothetical protein HY746_10610, partial [Elusimicrobia bacterium]|nr:hypothetical protein [Elusimicrobiota bacterium]